MTPVLQLLLLLLQLLLQLSAQDFHSDIGLVGCSELVGDTTRYKEFMYGLDEEVVAYADFELEKMIYPQPPFVDPIEYPDGYAGAVANQPICKANLQFLMEQLKDERPQLVPPGAPLLYPRDHLKPSVENTLVCHASAFFPAPVKFFWTKDRVNVSSTSVSQAYPQSDGTFSQFSTLQVLPEEGQVYSCSVEHPALTERKTRLWTVELQKHSLASSVFCGVGLTLGLVGVAVGTFFLVKGNECR